MAFEKYKPQGVRVNYSADLIFLSLIVLGDDGETYILDMPFTPEEGNKLGDTLKEAALGAEELVEKEIGDIDGALDKILKES